MIAVDANELSVKQANNTSDAAVLRRPRREHAVRHVRGRGRHASAAARRWSGRTAPSATWPARRPAARRCTLNSTGAYVAVDHPGQHQHPRRPLLDPGLAAVTARRRRSTSTSTAASHKTIAADLEVRVAVRRRDRAAATRRVRPARGTSTTRPTSCSDQTVPGRQHDQAAEGRRQHGTTYAIDFINLEQATPIANPDPAQYVVPAGFTQQDVQNALDTAGRTPPSSGVYLPAGDYQTSSASSQVYGKAIKVVGAGPWFTRFVRTADPGEHRRRLRRRSRPRTVRRSAASRSSATTTAASTAPARSSTSPTSSNITIDNIWVEHMVCLYWGANTDNIDDQELADPGHRSPTAST